MNCIIQMFCVYHYVSNVNMHSILWKWNWFLYIDSSEIHRNTEFDTLNVEQLHGEKPKRCEAKSMPLKKVIPG